VTGVLAIMAGLLINGGLLGIAYGLRKGPQTNQPADRIHCRMVSRSTFSGSSELSMVGACLVGPSSVGGQHDSQPIMIKVFESVGH
jgi:hypothetical protein